MNGAHDMGGDHGHGPIVQEDEVVPFHASWEGRSFVLNLSSGGGRWNIDAGRFAREDRLPTDYLASNYYELWLKGLERLTVEAGMVTVDEIEAARAGASFDAVTEPALSADNVEAVMRGGGTNRLDVDAAPKFAPGQSVRASVDTPPTHTRCPQYVRGRTGVIDRDHGVFTFPDTNAHGLGRKPQHIYSVRFEAQELWGSESQGGAVYVDLWDDYLEPA